MARVKSAERVIVRGEGAYLWDADGHRVLDVPASLWCANVGHGRREIAEAVADQISTLETYATFGRFTNIPARELAARICRLVPVPDPKVYLSGGGSDAIDTAAKIVWRYWNVVGQPEKQIMVSRTRGYHGLHVFGTSITGTDANRDGYGPLLQQTVTVDPLDPAALEEAIAKHGAESIAAFFCEPVIGGGGIIPPPAGYLESVQRICRENDIVFVVDEVITGFGRTGHMFASERFGLTPDVMVLAKGISSAYLPLGATVVSERLWKPFWRDDSTLVLRHGITSSGHAAVCRAALVNLDILEREDLVGAVLRHEKPLWEAVQRLADHELVTEVRGGIGLIAGVDVTTTEMAARIVELSYERGLLMRVVGDGCTLQISPPFVVTPDEIQFICASLRDVLDHVADAVNFS